MLTTPSSDESNAVFSDWLEFRAVLKGTASFSELPRAWEEEYGEDEVSDMDVLTEETQISIGREIDKRKLFLQGAYPFLVDSNSIILKDDLREEQYAYLLCLYLSSAETHILDQDITDHERKLFQLVSTVSASGYFDADAIWFGFPRPNHDGFHTALKKAFGERIKEGIVCEVPPLGTNTNIKDGEIDVIVHKKMNDELPGQLLFYGQIASGINYVDKPLTKEQINSVCYSWFQCIPSMDFLRGIFIPFCAWHQIEGQLGTEALKTRISQETVKYGIIFTRYRIPFYLYMVLEKWRNQALITKVDGLGEIAQITEWGKTFIEKLRADHNAA